MHRLINFLPPLFVVASLVVLLGGCAIANFKQAEQTDPWRDWNKNTQSFNDNFDKTILKPAAVEYLHVTNHDIDEGVSNFFYNINDLAEAVNDFFQLKLLHSGMDISRFVINTTAGVGGIFDLASKIDLPRHQEDVGQTLAFWGIPSGPYFVLPFFGPSTPRETIGLIGDASLDPLTYVSIFGGLAGFGATVFTSALDITDHRAALMSKEKMLNEATMNKGERYDFIKSTYLQHRDFLNHDGELDQDDPLAH
ncbi:MAG: VacJ family lipoprotein [Methylomonas sp.]|jgi:phospholipid-binding lipoprotein MlaA